MGLFDNIFLDKDTPTALLDNPEIKKPAGESEAEKPPYDPKNDPIAPAIDDTKPDDTNTQAETKPEDISFDIGGDLDFSATPTESTDSSINSEIITQDVPEAPKEDMENSKDMLIIGDVVSDSTTNDTGMSSIAMIQGGTAGLVEGIDLGGTTDTNTVSISTQNEDKPGIQIEIQNIEDHQVGDASDITNNGIYGFMDNSTNKEEGDNVTTNNSTIEIAGEAIDSTEPFTTSGTTGDALGTINEVKNEDNEISANIGIITGIGELPTSGGRIQELIGKLITELHTLDEEEKKKENEKISKIEDIQRREEALEHEYTTRKEALQYERTALENIDDKAIEKERIKSLIASFQEDLG
ncbi:hypothetical protein KBD33_05580 [Candidatus Gracilibacteria bacterium]|nr:hypothetical protein [Candidatus Gracilibacteria bacterium]